MLVWKKISEMPMKRKSKVDGNTERVKKSTAFRPTIKMVVNKLRCNAKIRSKS